MDTLAKAQAVFHQNMADTEATNALSDAIENLQNAFGERRKAEQAMKASLQALNDAQRKLTDAQKQAMAKVTAQAKQDVDAMARNRAETRNKFKEQDGEEVAEKGTVSQDSALPEQVSNEGNPLAPVNEIDIMGEGTQGENASGAVDAGKASGLEAESSWKNTVPKVKSDEILKTPKGSRPDPITYLNNEYIANHLAKFSKGVTKIAAQAPKGTAGPPSGTFVMPSYIADDLIARAGGNVAKLEELLGLPLGSLGNNPVRIDIENPTGLRLPSGNELGANSQWIPGGYTSGGLLETIIDPPVIGAYVVTPIKIE